jgi:uncharacterized membrane protein (UPF0182 family)
MKSPGRFVVLLLAVIVFIAGPSLVRFYTDWLWFGEVGYRHVFLTMLQSQGTLFTLTFVASALWFAFNLSTAVKAIGHVRPVFTTREGIALALPSRQQLRSIALAASVLLAIILGLFAAGRWETWLTWRFGVPFGEPDPILGHDVAFYVFSLPFLQLLRGLGHTLVIIAALASAGIYLVSGNLIRLAWLDRTSRRHSPCSVPLSCCSSPGAPGYSARRIWSIHPGSFTVPATPTSTGACQRPSC